MDCNMFAKGLLLAFGFCLSMSSAVLADAPAPSQALQSDRQEVHTGFALATDAFGALTGRYELRGEFAFHPYASVTFGIGWHRRDDHDGVGGGLTVNLRPQGEGLRGVWLGLGVDGAFWREGGGDFGVHGEVGYSWSWRGFFIGLGAGGRWRPLGEHRFEPLARVVGGWVWP